MIQFYQYEVPISSQPKNGLPFLIILMNSFYFYRIQIAACCLYEVISKYLIFIPFYFTFGENIIDVAVLIWLNVQSQLNFGRDWIVDFFLNAKAFGCIVFCINCELFLPIKTTTLSTLITN